MDVVKKQSSRGGDEGENSAASAICTQRYHLQQTAHHLSNILLLKLVGRTYKLGV